MEQGCLNATDFQKEIGKDSTVTKVLAGKKSLTKDHITNAGQALWPPCGNIFLTDNYRMHATNWVAAHSG